MRKRERQRQQQDEGEIFTYNFLYLLKKSYFVRKISENILSQALFKFMKYLQNIK